MPGKVYDQRSWKNLKIQYQAELIKTKGGATNTDFIDCGHTGMLLCFHWNVFKYVAVFSLDQIYYSYANVV